MDLFHCRIFSSLLSPTKLDIGRNWHLTGNKRKSRGVWSCSCRAAARSHTGPSQHSTGQARSPCGVGRRSCSLEREGEKHNTKMKRLRLPFNPVAASWFSLDGNTKTKEASAQGWDLWTKFALTWSGSSSLRELYLPALCLEPVRPGGFVHTFCCVLLFCSFGMTFGTGEQEIFWPSVQRSKMSKCMPANHRKGWRRYRLPHCCVPSGHCVSRSAASSAEAGGAVPRAVPRRSSHRVPCCTAPAAQATASACGRAAEPAVAETLPAASLQPPLLIYDSAGHSCGSGTAQK